MDPKGGRKEQGVVFLGVSAVRTEKSVLVLRNLRYCP